MLRWLTCTLMLLLALTCSACIPILHSAKPWVKYPMPAPPDRVCSIGHHSVTVYYIWDCVGGEHVVVSQFLSGIGPQSAQREAVRCGELTQTESKQGINKTIEAGACLKQLDDYRWPSSR